MNWYWPDHTNLTGIKKLVFLFLNWFLNFIAKVIWFKLVNAEMHDESYWEWETEADRIRSDTWFLRYLLIDCQWIKWKIVIAYIFYFSVRALWYHFFSYWDNWKHSYHLTQKKKP